MGKFDREGMEVWHIWFDHTKLGNAEPGCSRPDPSLVVLNVLLEGYLGHGKQGDRHTGFAFCSKATGRGPGERCGDERLSNFGGTRCHGMQTIVTHQICTSFEIAHESIFVDACKENADGRNQERGSSLLVKRAPYRAVSLTSDSGY